jgi:hypothetical protein
MCASLRVGLALAILGMAGRADAQPTLSQRDEQGAGTVVVTLAAPPQVGVPTRATVFLDTHPLALDGVAFDRAVVLRTPEGLDVTPTRVEDATGSGHHRQAVVSLRPVTQPGTMRIVVKDVGESRSGTSCGSCPPSRETPRP